MTFLMSFSVVEFVVVFVVVFDDDKDGVKPLRITVHDSLLVFSCDDDFRLLY